MSDRNLIPCSADDHARAVELGRKGGIASGEARRARIEMWKTFEQQARKKSKKRAMSVLESIIECLTDGAEEDPHLALKVLDLGTTITGEQIHKSEVDVNGDLPVVLTEEMIITDDELEEKPKKSAKRTGKR